MKLMKWQWLVLGIPPVALVSFLMIVAGYQLHQWGLSWVWAIFTLVFLGWRWLLVKWSQPVVNPLLTQIEAELEAEVIESVVQSKLEGVIEECLQGTQTEPPIWEDPAAFWLRCKGLVIAIAKTYHPEVKYPLLNLYVTQAYSLIRSTVDDVDVWMQKLSPILGQVTVGDAYQTYQTYQKIEPIARPLLTLWNWSQWLLNPAAAVTKQLTKKSNEQATQQLLVNFGQLLKEVALRNLAKGAVTLYSGNTIPQTALTTSKTPKQAQTLQEILSQAEPPSQVAIKPVNILLVGRTGAGKSSLINTLFASDSALVDLLPSTVDFQSYHWSVPTGETLTLWDSPGYEQTGRPDLLKTVLTQAKQADILLLVTPALDPALQMDLDFLKALKKEAEDLPVLVIVTQVDRLRPLREWSPPYDWKFGTRAKEQAILEAIQYRAQSLGDFCDRVLPLVTANSQHSRIAWGDDELSYTLLDTISPAKQVKLARFLVNQEARAVAAAQLIENYTFSMATSQGVISLLKSPLLGYLSIFLKIPPDLTYLLAQKIPVEQLPVVIGKLQMTFELFSLLKPQGLNSAQSGNNQPDFNLLSFWPILLNNDPPLEVNIRAFGQVVLEYYLNELTAKQLQERFNSYFDKKIVLKH